MSTQDELQGFLNALSEPAALIDRSFVFRAVNEAMASSLKRDVGELVGRSMYDVLPRRVAEERATKGREAFETGEPIVFEDQRGDRHFMSHVIPVKNAHGEVWAIAIYAVDTTHIKRTEASLRTSEARYRQILETCAEGVWQVDENGSTTYVNQPMAAMLGYEKGELLRGSVFDFTGENHEYIRERLQRRRQGVTEHYELKLRHRDGHEVLTMVSASPLFSATNQYLGSVGFITDVTLARQLEAQLLKRQKLESLGLIAGGVAHDFNNILAGVVGNVSLLEEMFDRSRGDVRDILRDIQAAAHRASELTAQLIAYSGQGSLVFQPVSIQRLVGEAVELTRSNLGRNTSIELNLGTKNANVMADASQLRQVLLNLVNNANEAIGGTAGTICIKTRKVVLRTETSSGSGEPLSPGEYAVVRVEDDGCGMTEATQQRIFDPFFSTKFEGRGLGLAAVAGIVRSHGGQVLVESQEGQGSSFELWLPTTNSLGDVATAADGRRSMEKAPSTGVVLIVDDDELVRKLAQRIVRKMGLLVLLARNGEEAIELFTKHRGEISLVLLDMTMPGLRGEKVLERLKEIDPKVKVILSSGFTQQSLLEPFDDTSSVDFLHKPYKSTDLQGMIAKLLKGTS